MNRHYISKYNNHHVCRNWIHCWMVS